MTQWVVAVGLVLAFATPGYAQDPRWVYPAVVGAQVADWQSTRKALDAGAMEANPLLAKCAQSNACLGSFKLGVAGLQILVSEGARSRGHARLAFWWDVAVSGTVFAVAAHNYHVARLARQR